MEIKELQSALRLLESLYAAGGALKQAESLTVLIRALDGHGSQSVEAFVEDAKQKLDIASKRALKGNSVVIDPVVVNRHVEALFGAGINRERFDTVFKALTIDASAKVVECVEIANIYKNRPTNGAFKYKFDSRTKALDFIFDTFLGRAQDDSKAGIINKMTKWAIG